MSRIDRTDLTDADAVRAEVATKIMAYILGMKKGQKVIVECLSEDGPRMFNIKVTHKNKGA